MKYYLVVDETSFYHPDFVCEFIIRSKDEIVGAAIIRKIPQKSNLENYLLRHWYYLRLSEIIKLAFVKYYSTVCNIFVSNKSGKFYSVEGVLRYFSVDFLWVDLDINQTKYLSKISSKNPDVIISSCSLYFGKELLNIPKYCCINRHSSILPSYKGLWPVFHSYKNGEFYTGASIHIMNSKIDNGLVLASKKVPIGNDDTLFTLYKLCFKVSVDVLLEAMQKISCDDFSPVLISNVEESYFSFPTAIDWYNFRLRGGRFI